MEWCLFSLWMQMASIYSVAVNILNNKLWVANKQRSSSLVSTPYHKNIKCYEVEWTDRDLDRLSGYSKTMMIPV